MSVYDWQADKEDSFLKWMVVNLLSGLPTPKVDELGEATDKFQRINLTIQINGVDVPVDHFVSSIESNMQCLARREAEAMLQAIPQLTALRAGLEQAEAAATGHLRGLLKVAGMDLELPGEEW